MLKSYHIVDINTYFIEMKKSMTTETFLQQGICFQNFGNTAWHEKDLAMQLKTLWEAQFGVGNKFDGYLTLDISENTVIRY